jgi:hypothetical protein
MTEILACSGCGRTKSDPTGDPSDLYPSEHCGDCPPWTCQTCGEVCSAKELCSCWVSLEDMGLADIKALLATDGTFSVGGLTPRRTDGAA